MKSILYRENPRRDSHLIDIKLKLRRLEKNDMTYILGAKCRDGVVLVGDTKITVDEGTSFEYGKKRYCPNLDVLI